MDMELVAWLSKSRSLHHLADLAEAEQADARAVELLTTLVTGATPSRSLPEVREVLADSLARLAELLTRKGDFEAGERYVQAGLELASEPSYFRGHLFEVRGLLAERQAVALAAAGRTAEAAEARKRAVEASLEAVRIQDAVIRRSLDETRHPE